MITNFEKPEILSPAGDMDCLKSALNFGADAVFLAGKMFGMRSAPQNFDNDQLKKACDLAHAKGARIHVTCNTLPRNNEIPHLQEFMENAQACGVDAFIIADLGVFEAAKKYAPKVQRHISTQAGVTNYAAANVLYNMGASRVVLAREIPLDEIAEMRAKVPKELEIECFVHGAMCVSFSGRCLISSYMTGRDANHGDCAQPCRWKYHLYEENRQGQYFPVEETGDGTYLYNSRDLCMIEHIPELVKAGVSSFKIEGRAKSAYYVAVTTNAYRHAVDDYFAEGDDYVLKPWIREELEKSATVSTTQASISAENPVRLRATEDISVIMTMLHCVKSLLTTQPQWSLSATNSMWATHLMYFRQAECRLKSSVSHLQPTRACPLKVRRIRCKDLQ